MDKFELEVGASKAKISVTGPGSSRITTQFSDLLSPFSELVGLAGDHMRIYRAESVAKRLLRAKEIAAAEGARIAPVHPKNLIPWIENASLEEESDNCLGEMWSRLLLSGHQKFDPEFALLTDILKRLGNLEAELLSDLCVGPEFWKPNATDSVLYSQDRETRQREGVEDVARSIFEYESISTKQNVALSVPVLRVDQVCVMTVDVQHAKKQVAARFYHKFPNASLAIPAELRSAAFDTAYQVLSHEGLARTIVVERIENETSVRVLALGATRLGCRLVRRCQAPPTPSTP